MLRGMAKIYALLAPLVLLAGCASFQPRPIDPSTTAAALEARTLDAPALRRFIERNLGHEVAPWQPQSWDMTLLTLAAFYYHPDMDVARAKWNMADAAVIIAGGHPNPDLGSSAQYNRDAPAAVSPWTLGWSLNIPFETANKRGYRAEQAQYLSQAARLNLAAAAWQVRSRLRAALLDNQAAQQNEAALLEQEAAQAEMVRLMEKRLAVGEAARPDVTQSQISLAQTRLALQNARILFGQVRTRLATAIGVPTDALSNVAISLNGFALPPPEDMDAAGLHRWALTNRADILAALAEYEASQAALQLEVANQYPNLRLGPGYTWDAGAAKWSLGLSLPLPLLNRNEGPIAEAEARRKLAAANFAAVQARVLGEIEQALAGYRSAAQALAAADTSLAEHKQVRRSAVAQFKAAEIDRLGTVSTQTVVTLADVARGNAWVAAQRALGRIEDALQRPLDAPLPAVPETNPREENKP